MKKVTIVSLVIAIVMFGLTIFNVFHGFDWWTGIEYFNERDLRSSQSFINFMQNVQEGNHIEYIDIVQKGERTRTNSGTGGHAWAAEFSVIVPHGRVLQYGAECRGIMYMTGWVIPLLIGLLIFISGLIYQRWGLYARPTNKPSSNK